MCETFKWIKLLVVESQKDGLQIPVKISLGKWLWATRELFKICQKYKYLTIRVPGSFVHSIFNPNQKLKIDVNFWFSWFFIIKSKKKRNWKCLTIFLSVEHWNRTYILDIILSTMKRKMDLSGNFVSPTMLQSVAWLNFSIFDGSLKIENWKLIAIFNFCFFWPKHSKSLTELPQREGV